MLFLPLIGVVGRWLVRLMAGLWAFGLCSCGPHWPVDGAVDGAPLAYALDGGPSALFFGLGFLYVLLFCRYAK